MLFTSCAARCDAWRDAGKKKMSTFAACRVRHKTMRQALSKSRCIIHLVYPLVGIIPHTCLFLYHCIYRPKYILYLCPLPHHACLILKNILIYVCKNIDPQIWNVALLVHKLSSRLLCKMTLATKNIAPRRTVPRHASHSVNVPSVILRGGNINNAISIIMLI